MDRGFDVVRLEAEGSTRVDQRCRSGIDGLQPLFCWDERVHGGSPSRFFDGRHMRAGAPPLQTTLSLVLISYSHTNPRPMKRSLPPLNGVRAFEAAARH